MSSQLLNELTIILYLMSLLTIFYFDRASCVKNEVSPFARCFKQTPQSYLSDVQNETTKIRGLVDNQVIFPDILSPNVSIMMNNLQTFSHHTGYYDIENSYGARMFYFFFESRRDDNDPVVLWLSGGPGEGSLAEVFFGNGPFRINDDLRLEWNTFGWDKASHMLYVDQPIGVGYSYSSDYRDYRDRGIDVVNDLYDFLKAFFEHHPKFIKNDFYIAGSSYAGHIIPSLASRIQNENKAKKGVHINLKGFAIGSGLINPHYHSSSLHDYALANRLISRKNYKQMKKISPQCLQLIQQCQTQDDVCVEAMRTCKMILHHMLSLIGNDISLYDIRSKNVPRCGFVSRLVIYLKKWTVKRALKVGKRRYTLYNHTMINHMAKDFMKNYADVVPQLLEDGIKVLIYNGEYDLLCNWLGNLRWMDAMEWSGHRQFLNTKLTSYIVDDKRVGKTKRNGPLTFLKVNDASHGVHLDQPKVVFEMFKKWIDT